jgi:hypothetical protein
MSSGRLAHYMEGLFDEESRRWPTNPSLRSPMADASTGPGHARAATTSVGTGSGHGSGFEPTLASRDPQSSSRVQSDAAALDRYDSVLSRIVGSNAALSLDDLTDDRGGDVGGDEGGPAGTAARDPDFGQRGGGRGGSGRGGR